MLDIICCSVSQTYSNCMAGRRTCGPLCYLNIPPSCKAFFCEQESSFLSTNLSNFFKTMIHHNFFNLNHFITYGLPWTTSDPWTIVWETLVCCLRYWHLIYRTFWELTILDPILRWLVSHYSDIFLSLWVTKLVTFLAVFIYCNSDLKETKLLLTIFSSFQSQK
jgi:hypothetical protein